MKICDDVIPIRRLTKQRKAEKCQWQIIINFEAARVVIKNRFYFGTIFLTSQLIKS